MKFLRHIGLVFSLSIVGVLAGLMAALSAEAQAPPSSGVPTLTILSGGTTHTITVVTGGTNCNDSAANNPAGWICYSVTTGTYGDWIVGNYTSTNKARVIVNDVAGSGSPPPPDNWRLTGITVRSQSATSYKDPDGISEATNIACGSITQCRVGLLRLTKFFAVGNAPASSLRIQKGMAGKFDPPSTENVVNNTMKLVGTACWAAGPCDPADNGSGNIGTALTVGRFTSPYTLNQDGGIGRSDSAAAEITASCTTEPTNPDKCQPTVQYEYKFEIQGQDTLILDNSLEGCNIICTDDPAKVSRKLPYCPDVAPICIAEINNARAKDKANLEANGGVEAQVCEGACIVIRVKGTPPGDAAGVIFDFKATGLDITDPDPLTLDKNPDYPDSLGTGQMTFSNLTPDLNPAIPDSYDRIFSIPIYPDGGAQGKFQTDQITCTSQYGSTCSVQTLGNNSSVKLSVTVHTLVPDDLLFISWHVH
jgi:hypothetical protein